jgi:hypothetical protein
MGKVEAFPADASTERVILSLETANGGYAPLYSIFREYIKNITYEKIGDKVRVCNLNPDYVLDSSPRPDSS